MSEVPSAFLVGSGAATVGATPGWAERLRTLLLLGLALGWIGGAALWPERIFEYAGLSLVAFGGCALLLAYLPRRGALNIHLWVILLTFLVGYFVKFWLLLYLRQGGQSDLLFVMLGAQMDVVAFDDILLEAYRVTVLAFAALCLTAAAVLAAERRHLVERGLGGEAGGLQAHACAPDDATVGLGRLLAAVLAVGAITVLLQAATGVASPAAPTREPLPFRLAGVLQFLRTMVVPAMLLLIAHLSDRAGARRTAALAVAAFVALGAAAAILTTSKIPLLFAPFGLMALWISAGTFGVGRRRLVLLVLPVVLLTNLVLGVARQVRIVDGAGALSGVLQAIIELFEASRLLEAVVASLLQFIVRFQGIDPVLLIVNYQPLFDLENSWRMLTAEADVTYLYGSQVFRAGRALESTAFSTSLVGFFYFVLGSASLTCVGVAAYLVGWHVLFRWLASLRLEAYPPIVAMACLVLAQFTSEGTLQALPMALAQWGVAATLAEIVARRVLPAGRGAHRAAPLCGG